MQKTLTNAAGKMGWGYKARLVRAHFIRPLFSKCFATHVILDGLTADPDDGKYTMPFSVLKHTVTLGRHASRQLRQARERRKQFLAHAKNHTAAQTPQPASTAPGYTSSMDAKGVLLPQPV